jgi:UDP-glucuronate decarboxylase
MTIAKKILVTGGAGFVGSHLCKTLLEQGHHVIALDNLYTGRHENIQNLYINNKFSFINHDITKPIDLAVDWIFNFACPASPPHYQKDPVFTTKTSVLGALNMLELARKNNARIMQASTSEVYGNPLIHPQTESYLGNVNCTGPRACYDESKRCAESLFFDYKRMYKTDIKIIRIFNTYGPHMDPYDGRVVSNFIVQALKGKSLTMYGDGTQTRSFCYIDDLVAGIVATMNTEQDFTGPINLGNPHEFTLLELAEKIKNILGITIPTIFQALPQDDPLQRKPDISLARKTLGWEPKINLDEGLKRTIEYFKRIMVKNKSTIRGNSTPLSTNVIHQQNATLPKTSACCTPKKMDSNVQ